MVENLIWEGTFDGRFEDRRHATEVFERHNAEVIESVPKDRLLVYEVKEGWGPLCEFLGVEAHDEPFPPPQRFGQLPQDDQCRIHRSTCRAGVPGAGGVFDPPPPISPALDPFYRSPSSRMIFSSANRLRG